MGWLRKIPDVFRLEKLRRLRNAEYKKENQKETLTWFGHVESMEDLTQSVTLLHYRQQKQRETKKNMDG